MSSTQEPARLEALARVAGAAGHGGGLDAVLYSVAEGILSAFGYESVVNFLDESLDAYVVRAVVGEGADYLAGSWNSRVAFDAALDPKFEVTPDVFFLPHDAMADPSDIGLGLVYTPEYEWKGAGYWHPEDACFVRMRTSRGRVIGVLSIDTSGEQLVPDIETFELIRLFATGGANAIENVLLVRDIAEVEATRETEALRHELQEELVLRRSLLDLGSRLGAASASATAPEDIFPTIAERLHSVVPFKALTIYIAEQSAKLCQPVYHSADDSDREALLSFAVPFGMGATGAAALTAETVISNIGQIGSRAVDIPDSRDIDEHLLTVPVLAEEQTRAVLTMRRLVDQPPFLPEDARRAEVFAQHVASVFLLTELANSRRLLADQVEKLEGLNRLKDEFVANVSHELRTPLTAVIGNVMTVAGLGDMLASQERRELLIAAERQAKRLAELLENLLAQSRLVGEDPGIVPSRVELGPFIEEVVAALRFRAPGREIETRAAKRLEVVTDRTLLYRILVNLGDNAIKYSDGRVQIEARPAGEDVRIEVSDHGVGIAADDIPRIFEQFEQLDGSSSRSVGGVGLGLHLCAKAARALGGRIDVRSEPGTGSTFSVLLPRAYMPVRTASPVDEVEELTP
jgi:signal transduction histidine kinase